jgi:hypothetical protein
MEAKAILKQLAICKCGDSIFNPDVKLGKEYRIEINAVRYDLRFYCGNCGAVIDGIPWVLAYEGFYSWAYLPLQCFNVEQDKNCAAWHGDRAA